MVWQGGATAPPCFLLIDFDQLSMADDFRHLGLFPFCFKRKKPEDIDLLIAENTPNYSGSYAGSLFPLKCKLQEAMDLYWRVKEINFDANLFFENDDYSEEAVVTSAAKIPDFEPIDELDSLRKRICGKPSVLQCDVDYIFTSKNPPGAPTTIAEKINIEWFAKDIEWGLPPLFTQQIDGNIFPFTLPSRGLATPKSAQIDTAPQSFWYYPAIVFTFARYLDTWTTFFPHYNLTVGGTNIYSTTGNEQTIMVKIPETDTFLPMKIYQIVQVRGTTASGNGTATFSDWTVELWPRPR